jgi:hypothetical protein
MGFRDLFNQTITVEEPVEKGEPVAAGKKRAEREGVFVTPQTIATFPVMSGLISGIWVIIEKAAQWDHALWLGFVLSVIAGGFLFAMHETDKHKRRDPRLFVRIGVALANTAVLFGAASGFYSWAR